MSTDTPWGIPIAYDGRAIVAQAGHTIHVRVYDTAGEGSLTPQPMTGRYPTVYVSATFTESGDLGAVLRGYGEVILQPEGANPVVPDPTAIGAAIADALANFAAQAAAYATLTSTWPPTAP